MKIIRTSVLLAAVLVSGCTVKVGHDKPTSPTTTRGSSDKEKLASWYDANSSLIDDISTATGDVSDAALASDFSGTSSACSELTDATSNALSADPIPVAAIDSHWQAALQHFDMAAQDCIDGVDSMDADLLSRASDEVGQGADEINLATTEINKVTG